MFFLRINQNRKTKSKDFKRNLEIILFLTFLALFFFWLIYALLTLPEITTRVSKNTILDLNKELSDHRCKCKNKEILYANFMKVDLGEECSERYPINWSVVNHDNMAFYSVCSVIRQSLLNQLNDRTLISDHVISSTSFEAHANFYVRNLAMNSYLIWIGAATEIGFYFKNGIDEGLLKGNNSKVSLPTQETEHEFNTWATWEFIAADFEKKISLNYDNYLDSCDPYDCRLEEKVTLTSTLLSGLGVLGGMYALFTCLGRILIDFYEGRKTEKRRKGLNPNYKNSQKSDKNSNSRSGSGSGSSSDSKSQQNKFLPQENKSPNNSKSLSSVSNVEFENSQGDIDLSNT
ncbi:hypothetical protein M0813_00917 [Anaeramoeba flamelloides]|uniref:Uncharacterized protein n=1 Tax=Anaeramoeba flamelloides TaxID=1746091 RepID=A0ABQ8X0I1_9EUKA|nr:hypothetical protein M0813_00917 [Anaeramoeba flamelloides]